MFDGEINKYFLKLRQLVSNFSDDLVKKLGVIIVNTANKGGRIFLCGNGGSAALANHVVCDLNKIRDHRGKRTIKAISLSSNIPYLSAISNDFSYEDVFKYQLIDNLKKEDILIAISCSGRSKNVLAAVSYAREVGIFTIAITGNPGNPLSELADFSIVVPSDDTQLIEDLHLIIFHSLIKGLKSFYEYKKIENLEFQIIEEGLEIEQE